MILQSIADRKSMNKRGQLITKTVMGIVFLVISVIIGFVLVTTVNDANLLTDDSAEKNLTDDMIVNLTDGIREISNKFVVILTILAVVFLFGALLLLVGLARKMNQGGGDTI